MSFYLIVIFFLVVSCLLNNKKSNRVTYFLFCAVLLTYACLRDATVGIDHEGYVDVSLGKSSRYAEREGVELVWGWLNSIFVELQIRPLFTIVTSMLTLLPIFSFIKKESNNIVFSLLLFLLIPCGFCFFLTGIRQSLATALVVWVFYYMNRKEFIKSLILFLMAIGIHFSAVFIAFFLPFYFLNIKKRTIFILLGASAAIGLLLKLNIFNVLSSLSPYIGIMSYYEGYGTYHVDEVMNLTGLISVIFPPTMFALIALRNKDKGDFYTKLFCMGVVATNLFANVPMIGRYFMYFTILQIILVPNVFKRCSPLLKLGGVLTVVYMILYFYLFIPQATGTDVYRFFF